jgi:hypothetical protein
MIKSQIKVGAVGFFAAAWSNVVGDAIAFLLMIYLIIGISAFDGVSISRSASP